MSTLRKRLLIAAAATTGIAVAAGLWLWLSVQASPFDIDETVYIYVRPADDTDTVRRQLTLTAHARTLLGWDVLTMAGGFTPRTGRYAVEPGARVIDVYRRLRAGMQTPVQFTLPAVRTLDRLAGVMAHKLMLDSADVATAFGSDSVAARYGYSVETLPAAFIPDTYELYWDTSFEAFMQRMAQEHTRFWQAGNREELANRLGLTHEEVATLASIVDAETTNAAEKPAIAGLYLNRLHRGMLLQADPTVVFAAQAFNARRVSGQMLHTESPYNTYKHPGLPPGPIRIASQQGIDAVLHAQAHNYIYMCANADFSGTHAFAATYAEHRANARRYQRALAARGIR